MPNANFRFLNYELSRMEFKRNPLFDNKNGEVDIDIKFGSVSKKEENGLILLIIGISLFSDSKNKNYPYELSFNICGFFHTENMLEETLDKYIKYNATAILFPYIRSIITNITSVAGQQPLILPTYNINNLLKNENIYSYKTFDEINN